MTEVYVVQFNSANVGKEGYSTLEKAISFINGRSYNPKVVEASILVYVDTQGNNYKILPITIK